MRLFDEFWIWRLRQSPEFATKIGIKDYNDMLETFTEERYHNDFKACKNFKERATKLLKTTKNPNVKINLRLFISEISSFIKGYHVKGFYFPITYLDGIHMEFQTLGGKTC